MNIQVPQGWIPISEAINFIEQNLMTKNVKFVLGNWHYKYVNLRIDMRSGQAMIQPGNIIEQKKG